MWGESNRRVFVIAGVLIGVMAISVAGFGMATASTGTPPAPNPSWPASCGLEVALVVDHSNSVALAHPGNPDRLKRAANQFVDALAGTPTSFGVVSFAGTAQVDLGLTPVGQQSGVDTVKAAVGAIPFSTDDPNGSTNWQAAFDTARTLDADILVLLTDGRPTVHAGDGLTGGHTSPEDVDAAVVASNRVKSGGTRVVAVGIGDVVDADNLARVSGPTPGDDHFLTDFPSLAARLQDVATAMCGGSLVISKEVVEDGAASVGGGWTFLVSADGGPPREVVTDPDGNIHLEWPGPEPVSVTVTEPARPGYALRQTARRNAVCASAAADHASANVDRGVRVVVDPDEIVRCTFTNIRLPSAIAVAKTADRGVVPSGERVRYDFEVTNPGEQDLVEIVLSDDSCAPVAGPMGDDGDDGVLTPGDTWTYHCEAVLAVTTTNVATVIATDLSGRPLQAEAAATVEVVNPAIQLSKSGPDQASPGEAITYTFVATNAGDTSLSDVRLTDAAIAFETEAFTLAPGANRRFDVERVVPDREDPLVNRAEVCGTAYGRTVCAEADHRLDVLHSVIDLDKQGPAAAREGDGVEYRLTVTNNGDNPLSGVVVEDQTVGWASEAIDLAPGASVVVVTPRWTVPAGGDVENRAEACGHDAAGVEVCDTDRHLLDVIHPEIEIDKRVSPDSVPHTGGRVTYTYEVRNPGDTLLSGIQVVDDRLGVIGATAELAPGGVVTFTKIVDLDLDDPLTNRATATGTDLTGRSVTATDDATVERRVAPAGSGATTVEPPAAVQGLRIETAPELPRTGDPLGGRSLLGGLLAAAGALLLAISRTGRRTSPNSAASR